MKVREPKTVSSSRASRCESRLTPLLDRDELRLTVPKLCLHDVDFGFGKRCKSLNYIDVIQFESAS